MNKAYYNEDIAERIRESVLTSGMSFVEICKRGGISRGNLWSWLQRGSLPSTKHIIGLCIALNISSDYLLGINIKGKPRKGRGSTKVAKQRDGHLTCINCRQRVEFNYKYCPICGMKLERGVKNGEC